tara:strand:- start:118 stop:1047 length:930 start_codon:yes stop_codon:yes gene_type:complete
MKIDMRDAFFERIVEKALSDERIIFLTADHGAFALKRFENEIPNRFINIGISEQNMMGVAAGLASSGKIVFAYGISPFVSLRVLEQITLDISAMKLPVNIVSVGAGFTYSTDGPTHHGLQDLSALITVPEINILNSSDPFNTKLFVDYVIETKKPHYIRIEKEKVFPFPNSEISIDKGFRYLTKKEGKVLIISTGIILHSLIENYEYIRNEIEDEFSVIDLFKIKPINKELLNLICNYKYVITLEEGYVTGMASFFQSNISNNFINKQVFTIGVKEKFIFKYSTRSELLKEVNLDVDGIISSIKKIMNC